MEKTYNPYEIEQRWYQTWESEGYFAPRSEGEPYSIMIPPPNVTGSLHMGHGFNNTVMDAMTRYHRMHGRNTLWQPGTDHAGIATQMVVERQLATDNKTRHDLGREAFIQRVWNWKQESGNNISQQLRRMGSSLDWENERFTMDEGLSNATKEVFVRLHEEGLIYRGKRLVNWDPVLHTAVSDLEVLNQEENGYLWHLRYPLADGEDFLVVATTRPETMLGDAAIAIHPGDERYKHLIGQKVKLPFTNRLIPILADDYVDPDFGTGIVKITPAHDFNDYQIWQRHRDETAIAELPHGGLINIFTISASIVDSDDENGALIPAEFQGLDRYAARKLLIEELAANGLLEKTDEHKLVVPRGDRSGAVIEPLLTDQWYVKVAPLAEPAIKAVEDGSIRFIPDNWKNTYYDWMHNIEDWCISRQIWWGHRIPAWYDEQGNIFVGRSEQEVRQKHKLADSLPLRQDEDVLDTWFSSALWPFSTLGWPENTERVKTFYPSSVLVTGFDIIFFWVARMIMMGLKFMDEVPFRDIYIHGLIRDTQGQKMSKSKGNVLDPIDLIDGIELEALVKKRTGSLMQPHLAKAIEKATRRDFPDGIPAFGTDALRFTFAALASTGRDISFDLQRVEGYRNFCNKLWNAARYVLMNTENQDCGLSNEERILSLPDVWITSRLQETIEQVNRHTTAYRLDLAAQSIYEFTWNEYCDWYLELSKPVLQNTQSSTSELRGTRATLIGILETLLRLAHPIMPFITEEIWQRIAPLAGKTGATIMLESFPVQQETLINTAAIEQMEWVKEFILGIRKIRSGMDIAPGKPLSILLQNASSNDKLWLDANRLFLQRLAKLEQIDYVGEQAPEAATALVGNMRILIPLAGLIDKDAEIARLDKEISKIEKLVNMTTGKLSNEKFVAKAPSEVVEKERTKLAGFQTSLDNLNAQRKRIRKI